MDANNGSGVPDLRAHMAQAAEVAQEQTRLRQKLSRAVTNPETVVRYNLTAVGIREEDGQKILMIATTDGTRRDLLLADAVVTHLKQALLGELNG